MRRLLARGAFPQDLAVGAIDRQHLELMGDPRADATQRFVRLLARDTGGERGEEKDSIAPHHRRCGAAAWNLYLPFDVFRFTPLDRRVRHLRHTRAMRAAPLWPV